MTRRTKREMAPPPNETGFAPHETGRFAPSSQIGSAPTVIQVPTPPSVLGGGPASTGGQAAPWWTGPSPQVTSSVVTSTNCGMDYYPPGGFTSFFQSGQPLFPHVSAPWPPMGKEPQLAPPKADLGNQNPKKKLKGKNIINLEDGNKGRTAKRLVFDPDEDVRLVSAWLIHSNDPVNGNCKKNEKYWGDVHGQYNKTTPTNRKREVKHLKDRWTKIKRWVAFFVEVGRRLPQFILVDIQMSS